MDPAAPLPQSLPVRLARPLCAALAVVDLGLAAAVLALPDLFVALLQPGLGEPAAHPLLTRTGVLWGFFCLTETAAAWRGPRLPELYLAVGVLRLMDVAADPTWLLVGEGFTWFGTASLIVAPAANLVAGLLLVGAYRALAGAATGGGSEAGPAASRDQGAR